jgi:hypothetical protein
MHTEHKRFNRLLLSVLMTLSLNLYLEQLHKEVVLVPISQTITTADLRITLENLYK